MQLEYSSLKVRGLRKPLRFFHITDCHLTQITEEEALDERLKELAAKRTRHLTSITGQSPLQILDAQMEQAKKLDCDYVIMTGDIIDYATEANLSELKRVVRSTPVFYTLGNHDAYIPFCNCEELKKKNLSLVEVSVGQSVDVNCRQVDELLLVGINNADFQITKEQYRKVEEILQRGLPVLLCCHIPFYCDTLLEDTQEAWGSPIIIGCPEEVYRARPTYRSVELTSNEDTYAFVEMLKRADNLVGIVAGHLHFSHTDMFTETKPQFITAYSAGDVARVIELVPQ